jgi:hypothetical protein
VIHVVIQRGGATWEIKVLNMRINRAGIILSTFLLAVIAVWWLSKVRRRSNDLSTNGQTSSNSALIGEKTADSPAPKELPHEPRWRVHSKQPQSDIDAVVINLEAALANAESPRNSQDFDGNRDWARKFPAEAAAWLLSAPDSPQRDIVAETVCPQMAETNPAAAVTLAEQCSGAGTNIMGNLLDNLAQIWADQDERAAYAWAVAKSPGEERDRLLHRIALVESKTDPTEAAHMVAEQMSPGENQNEAAISVLYQWAQRDAGAALAWAQSFPVGDFRDRAIKEVLNMKAFSSGGQATF